MTNPQQLNSKCESMLDLGGRQILAKLFPSFPLRPSLNTIPSLCTVYTPSRPFTYIIGAIPLPFPPPSILVRLNCRSI